MLKNKWLLIQIKTCVQVDGTKEQPITLRGPSSGPTAIIKGSDKSGTCVEINHDYYILDVSVAWVAGRYSSRCVSMRVWSIWSHVPTVSCRVNCVLTSMLSCLIFVLLFLSCLALTQSQDFTIDGQINEHCTKENVRESFRAKCLAIRGESNVNPCLVSPVSKTNTSTEYCGATTPAAQPAGGVHLSIPPFF